jgi:hypothetical protein
MRLSTIVACLLLVSPPSALACLEHAAEQTGWLHETPSMHRYFAAGSAEEASMLGRSLAGAGVASLALVVMAFRVLSRASRRGGAGPVEFEPAMREGPSSPLERPGDPWTRIDQGHERPEPIRAGRDEQALSGVLEMH